VKTFQAEDEIAAVCAAIGASFAGQIGLTGTSGPGVALKQEAIGLAVMTELPLVIVNVQRGGPSTGLPTKTEQADLFQAVWGRNGECPAIVIAPSTPADCFIMAIEAVRDVQIHVTSFYLSDGYLANGAEPGQFRYRLIAKD
jgi:2-oxoglutarate ferredoxin oxidoreductase subunit alpha